MWKQRLRANLNWKEDRELLEMPKFQSFWRNELRVNNALYEINEFYAINAFYEIYAINAVRFFGSVLEVE